jgi:hypothetical protein
MKSILHNSNFILKISCLLLILALGLVAQPNAENTTSLSKLSAVKTNAIKQIMENNWFTHQAR